MRQFWVRSGTAWRHRRTDGRAEWRLQRSSNIVGRAIIFASDDDDHTWKCATIQAKTLSLLKALMGGQLTKVFQVSYL